MSTRLQSEASARRRLRLLLDSHEGLLGKSVFFGWKDLGVMGRQGRELERLRSETMAVRLEKKSSAKRALALILSSQEGLLETHMFAAWKELAAAGRQGRGLQRLRSEVLRDCEKLEASRSHVMCVVSPVSMAFDHAS